MARICQCLTTSRGIQLVNNLIKNTEHLDGLVKFKEKFCSNSNPLVGEGYWNGFMKRNKHLIVSKHGTKYELSWDMWTTYGNFLQMYDHIIEELVDCGIAEELASPVWMDTGRNEVEEKDAFGCMNAQNITSGVVCSRR